MKKVTTSNNVMLNPMPLAIIGVKAKNKANFMPVGWIMRANNSPPMLAVAINRNHYTAELIRESKTFSVNIPSIEILDKTDYCGLVSGENVDKGALFKVFFGTLKTAPMIEECPVCMECKLAETLPLPSNYIFIGEITTVYTEEKYLTDGLLDVNKVNPPALTMPDCVYRVPGAPVGKAWSDGKKLIKK